MATIPGAADLGNNIAQPTRTPLTTPELFGSGLGRAVEQAGNERLAFERAEAAAQAHARELADRASAAQHVKLGEERMGILADELNEQIRLGRQDKATAEKEWQARSADFVRDVSEQVPATFKQQVSNALDVRGLALSRHVRGAAAIKDREDTKASLMGLIEAYERDATSDRPAALKKAAASIETLGAAAGLGADDQQRLMQQFREKSAATMADQRLLAASRDPRALDSFQQQLRGEEFADLSPDRREHLEQRIENKRANLQHAAEVAERRLEAARARRLTEGEHAVRAVQSIYDGGGIPDDGTLSKAQEKAAGGPWADVLKAAVQQGASRAAFGSLAPSQQDQALLEIRARLNRDGMSPQQQQQLQHFETIRNKTRELVDRDPLEWGVKSRLLPGARPLDLSSMQGFASTFAGRVDDASTVGAKTGRPTSPFFAGEAPRFGEMLSALPMDQKKAWLRVIASVAPPEQQRALAGQLKEQDGALALAMHAASMPPTAAGDPMALILRGHDAVAAGRIKKDDESTRRERMTLARELDAVPWTTPKARDAAADAAGFILDGLRDQSRSGMASSSDRTKAMQLALGGEIVDHGDGKTIAPPGWTENRFRAALRKVSAADIARQAPAGLTLNGQALTADALVKALPSARMVPLGPSRYALDLGGMVLGADRQYFTFTLGD